MRFFLTAAFTAFVAMMPFSADAVLYGDESYANLDGNFWTFYSGGVAIIDPDTCTITDTITTDNDGNPLPSSWSDGVYMQFHGSDSSSRALRRLHHEELEGYVLINSRVPRQNAVGDSVGDVYVFSTTEKAVSAIVEVGPRVVHAYGVHTLDEFWTHSDGDGHFYVIDLIDITRHESKVPAHSELAYHGKLLWNEQGVLGNRGFATSTGEPFLFELDLLSATLTSKYDFTNDVAPGTCGGLHAISFSRVNLHVYAECTGGGGTLEFDVSNGGIRFVHQHGDATGALYETPDGAFVVATDKGGDKLHIFKPNGSGLASSIEYTVQVPGHPSSPSFYPTSDGDIIACMPLTSNPNANQIDSLGNVACDYYNGCTGAASTTDVENGVCFHQEVEGSRNILMRVTDIISDIASNPACSRCADPSNFVNGTCVCTPNCGSCASSDFPLDLSRTGVACVDLGDVVAAGSSTQIEANLIPDAGAVRQGSPYSSSNECGFGRTYRSLKRGKQYQASISNYPQDSIVIIDMSTQTKKCQVNLPAAPARIVWAPTQPERVAGVGPAHDHEKEDNGDGLSGGAIAGIVIGVLVVVGIVGFVLWKKSR